MLGNCSSIKSLDLSSLNTSNVNDMSCMFYNCSSLKELDLSSFNTTKVNDKWKMFWNCFSLISLDLSSFNSFNSSHVKRMYDIFAGCSSLGKKKVKVTDKKILFELKNQF